MRLHALSPLARKLATAALCAGLAVSLSGCGKKGAPSPPGPSDKVHYPRVYPSE